MNALFMLLWGALLLDLTPGLNKTDAEGLLAKHALENRSEHRAADDQALAHYLVRTRFLETLNHFRLAPVDARGELDPAAFQHLMRGSRQGRDYVLAFDERGLRFVFARLPIAVDGPNDSPKRMNRLRSALKEIEQSGFKLSPKEKDRYGNVYSWTGGKIAVWYVPEADELRVVLHQR